MIAASFSVGPYELSKNTYISRSFPFNSSEHIQALRTPVVHMASSTKPALVPRYVSHVTPSIAVPRAYPLQTLEDEFHSYIRFLHMTEVLTSVRMT